MIRLKATRQFRRALSAARKALARHSEPQLPVDLVGRWALPSGATFAVYRSDGLRALCGNGRERWHVPTAQLTGLLERGTLRYLGRVRG